MGLGLRSTVAALYVIPDGPYSRAHGVELWGLPERDARLYRGPHPVVAHPPCARWGRYWSGGPSYKGPRLYLGDDDGCFLEALWSVRIWGGVLEHPAYSTAWPFHGLSKPPRVGGWVPADTRGGITCHVEQGAYGHRARKATWLYACRINPLELKWGKADGDFMRLDQGFHSAEERKRAIKTWMRERLTARQMAETPIEFRDVLLAMARRTI